MLTSVRSVRLDMSLYTEIVVPHMSVFPFLSQREGWHFGFLRQSPETPSPPSWCPEGFDLSTDGFGANLRQQSRALVGQPFRIPNTNDPVTSAGGGGIGI